MEGQHALVTKGKRMGRLELSCALGISHAMPVFCALAHTANLVSL